MQRGQSVVKNAQDRYVAVFCGRSRPRVNLESPLIRFRCHLPPILVQMASEIAFAAASGTIEGPFVPRFGTDGVRNRVCGAQWGPNGTTSGFILVFRGFCGSEPGPRS